MDLEAEIILPSLSSVNPDIWIWLMYWRDHAQGKWQLLKQLGFKEFDSFHNFLQLCGTQEQTQWRTRSTCFLCNLSQSLREPGTCVRLGIWKVLQSSPPYNTLWKVLGHRQRLGGHNLKRRMLAAHCIHGYCPVVSRMHKSVCIFSSHSCIA